MPRGRVPKPPGERRNRNRLRSGEWVRLPATGPAGPPPSTAGYGLSRASLQWWRQIWRSPSASQWVSSDVPALLESAL